LPAVLSSAICKHHMPPSRASDLIQTSRNTLSQWVSSQHFTGSAQWQGDNRKINLQLYSVRQDKLLHGSNLLGTFRVMKKGKMALTYNRMGTQLLSVLVSNSLMHCVTV